MMRWLKQSWQLYLLRREGERIRQAFLEGDDSEAAIEKIAARNVGNMFAIDEIKTDRLLRSAEKYDVPIPSMLLLGNRNDFWSQSPFDKHVKVLTERARADLRAEIWEAQRTVWERRTRWVPLLAGLTGLLGTANRPDCDDSEMVLNSKCVTTHKTLRVTPAMAAGVTDRVWDMTDIAALIAAQEALVAKRGPYRKRAA